MFTKEINVELIKMTKAIKKNLEMSIADFDSLRIILSRANLNGCDTLVLNFARRILDEYESLEGDEEFNKIRKELADEIRGKLNNYNYLVLD